MLKYILAIDDELNEMEHWYRALERERLVVRRAADTAEARRTFYVPGFSLVIMDRSMPRGRVMDGNEHEPIHTGRDLYSWMRGLSAMSEMPVIFLTNFVDEDVRHLEERDERALVIDKADSLDSFVRQVKDWIERWPIRSAISTVDPREHPNCAPYYIRNTDWGSSTGVKVHFDFCDGGNEIYRLNAPEEPKWMFGEMFSSFLADSEMRQSMLKMMISSSEEIIAFSFLDPAPNLADRNRVLFETAPGFRVETRGRRYREVGLVGVGWYLRKCLYDAGKLANYVDLRVVNCDPREMEIGVAKAAADFFRRLGFEYVERLACFRAPVNVAQRILDRVHDPYGAPELPW